MAKKSAEKKSFRLYNDYKRHFDIMNNEEAGQTIKAVFAFVNGQDIPELGGMAEMAFSFIESQLRRDMIAYDKKCEINRQNGMRGGRPRKEPEAETDQYTIPGIEMETQKNPEEPNGFSGLSEKPSGITSEDPKKSARKDYPEGFKRFWDAYPKNKDKGLAYRAYSARIKDGYSPEELEQAAIAYRDECKQKRTPQEYIKHAKTFLGPSMPFTDYLPKDEEQEAGQSDGYGEVDFRQYVSGGRDT